MNQFQTSPRLLSLLLILILASAPLVSAKPAKRSSKVPQRSATTASKTTKKAPATTAKKGAPVSAKKKPGVKGARVRTVSYTASRNSLVAGGPWKEPTFADSTSGDHIDGEDLTVRRAAVEAIGPYNGSVVVADPQTGRILTIVNQKVAFSAGFQPCSTVKIVTALAGLSEGVIDRNTQQKIYGRVTMNLTDALAKSNNPYFSNVGVKLGFDKVAHYAKMYGLGEKAGLNIEDEQPGLLPETAPKFGGVGMMTSFGEGIKLTPLQLIALVSAVANGGTLYYLQYPKNELEASKLQPKVKRHLPIAQVIPELTPGMLGATEYGTARRAAYDTNEPIFGKTGTCTDRDTPTHLGWFGSFQEIGGRKLAVVVLLTGGRYVNGPTASGVAGHIYRTLSQQKAWIKTAQNTAIPVDDQTGYMPEVVASIAGTW